MLKYSIDMGYVGDKRSSIHAPIKGERMSTYAENEHKALTYLQRSYPSITLTLHMLQFWNGKIWEYVRN
jgi:hypothetical protein